jgi:hypothetical protein
MLLNGDLGISRSPEAAQKSCDFGFALAREDLHNRLARAVTASPIL